MRTLVLVGLVVAVFVGVGVSRVDATQYFTTQQSVRAYALNDWSFLTAWDLSNGQLQISPDWYNGTYVWNWTMQYHQHWFALFVYDDGTGQTRELCWVYSQDHIQ
ncbi:MAG TPA: hypothetical protein PLE77_05425 [Kiritimatiellia bacterium]|nr:hypothetical protein [Kiritimatiellia bacterium]